MKAQIMPYKPGYNASHRVYLTVNKLKCGSLGSGGRSMFCFGFTCVKRTYEVLSYVPLTLLANKLSLAPHTSPKQSKDIIFWNQNWLTWQSSLSDSFSVFIILLIESPWEHDDRNCNQQKKYKESCNVSMGYQNYILHITNNAGMNSNAWPGELYLMLGPHSLPRGFSPLKDTPHLTQRPVLILGRIPGELQANMSPPILTVSLNSNYYYETTSIYNICIWHLVMTWVQFSMYENQHSNLRTLNNAWEEHLGTIASPLSLSFALFRICNICCFWH